MLFYAALRILISQRNDVEGQSMYKGPKIYGYIRYPIHGKSLASQLAQLSKFGVKEESIFTDRQLGLNASQTQYEQIISLLHDGDVLAVGSLDCLGESHARIVKEWTRITSKLHAHIVVLDMPSLDTRENVGDIGAAVAELLPKLLDYFVDIEKQKRRHHQAEGIADAKARGVRFGRPMLKRPENYDEVLDELQTGNLTRREAASRLGVGITTLDKWRAQDECEEGR